MAINSESSFFSVVMEKFSSVLFSTLNLQTPNQTIRSVRQFSGTLNGTWRSGSKSVRFTFELRSNANVSWDPPAGACAPVWCGGSGRDSLVGVLQAIPMDLQPHQGAKGRRHARGGGEVEFGIEHGDIGQSQHACTCPAVKTRS